MAQKIARCSLPRSDNGSRPSGRHRVREASGVTSVVSPGVISGMTSDTEPPVSGRRRAASAEARPETPTREHADADGGASGAGSQEGMPRSNNQESVLARFEHMLAQIRQGACIPERTSLMGELV